MADPTMNRQSGGLDLTPQTQAEIWQNAAYQSAFMQLVPQVNLPGKGVRVPIITGDPEADWVAEGTVKPKSGVGFSKKDMVPYTIAVILPFSNQFRRAGHPAGIADQRVRPVDHHDRRQAGEPVVEEHVRRAHRDGVRLPRARHQSSVSGRRQRRDQKHRSG